MLKPGSVTLLVISDTQEAEQGGFQVQGQPHNLARLYLNFVLKNEEKKKGLGGIAQ